MDNLKNTVTPVTKEIVIPLEDYLMLRTCQFALDMILESGSEYAPFDKALVEHFRGTFGVQKLIAPGDK